MKEFLDGSLNFVSAWLTVAICMWIVFFILNWVWFGLPDGFNIRNGFMWGGK